MKKSNLIKAFSVLLIGAMLVTIFNVKVLAATDDDGFNDITNTVGRNNTNTNGSNTNSSNTNRSNTNTNNTNRTNNTASIYNDSSNLPQTGIEDSIPVALLVVVFGISAVYAYKKIKEYRNI